MTALFGYFLVKRTFPTKTNSAARLKTRAWVSLQNHILPNRLSIAQCCRKSGFSWYFENRYTTGQIRFYTDLADWLNFAIPCHCNGNRVVPVPIALATNSDCDRASVNMPYVDSHKIEKQANQYFADNPHCTKSAFLYLENSPTQIGYANSDGEIQWLTLPLETKKRVQQDNNDWQVFVQSLSETE